MLGDNIKRIRKDKKISINNLSKKTGISLGYMSDLENGKAKNPSIDKLNVIASALEVNVDEFFKMNQDEKIQSWTDSMDSIENTEDKMRYLEAIMDFAEPDEGKQFLLTNSAFIDTFNKLDDEDKKKVINYTKDLSDNIKYIKDTNVINLPENKKDSYVPITIAAHDDNLTNDEKYEMNERIAKALKGLD
ncbi:helix-turn-helix transcriptional regulator [Clostridium gasigenes]|uniref:helix-turn-helix domain-containing protein n=1 Tax=Clostridium gasigenes TaxID=94869 RepID=UPI0016251521|nr:helix-turn-helix transcriptional regulator [Clostridium gasigenes]MBB6622068.1 helix-turn-helix transcriptional regulator [Clostridium gasigenes]